MGMATQHVNHHNPNIGRGSTSNVLAAICSFFIPGLGQLTQGRPWKALFHFIVDVLLWLILLGWLMHIWSCIEAAIWQPKYTHR